MPPCRVPAQAARQAAARAKWTSGGIKAKYERKRVENEAATAVQCAERRRVAVARRHALARARRAAVHIQACRRALVVLRMRRQKLAAARRIQARVKVKGSMAALRRAKDSALVMQCEWRGVLARKIAFHQTVRHVHARAWRARATRGRAPPRRARNPMHAGAPGPI